MTTRTEGGVKRPPTYNELVLLLRQIDRATTNVKLVQLNGHALTSHYDYEQIHRVASAVSGFLQRIDRFEASGKPADPDKPNRRLLRNKE